MLFHRPLGSAALFGAAAHAHAIRAVRQPEDSPRELFDAYNDHHVAPGTASSGLLTGYPTSYPTASGSSGSSGSLIPFNTPSSLGYSIAPSYVRTSPAGQSSDTFSTTIVTQEITNTVPYTTVITVYPVSESPVSAPAGYTGDAGSSPAGPTTYTTTLESTIVSTQYSTLTVGEAPSIYTSAANYPSSGSDETITSEVTASTSYQTVSTSAVSSYESSSVTAPASDSSVDSATGGEITSVPLAYQPGLSSGKKSDLAFTTTIPFVTTTCAQVTGPYDAGNATYPIDGSSSASAYAPTGTGGSYEVCSTITLTSVVSIQPSYSANSTSAQATGTARASVSVSAQPTYSANSTSAYLTGSSRPSMSASPIVSSNSTTVFATGTMAPTPSASVSAKVTANSTCADLCSSLTFSDFDVTPILCKAYEAGTTIPAPEGQSAVSCNSNQGALTVGVCRVTLTIKTSDASEAYAEVWMPNDETTSWNGRTMSTDNGGLSGCVAYDDMTYVTGLGFTAFGDNGGHNSSAFDGSAFYNNNQRVLDWAYRSRHSSVVSGKEVVKQFYGEEQDYAYYIGCSTGGQQGMHSAQYFPDDFDGIIAGSAAADFNHLEDWSARFVNLTGTSSDDARFLTEDDWIFVQSYLFAQCDESLDGVNDGIIEDPTACHFDSSAIPVCNDTETDSCLTSTQIDTVNNVFTPLLDSDGKLLYPALLYGSQVDAFRLGSLDGSTQGIAHDWYAYGVYNNSDFDLSTLSESDWDYADSLDAYHGHVSSFNGDLSSFQSTGGKMIIYHGMADPMVSGNNAARYYLKVQSTMGLSSYTDLDPFMRLFRISGMAHCGVGGISGAGAWMFGQNADADPEGVAENIIDTLMDWVENDNGPETITGTKFWYDTPSYGVDFTRPHCRYPFRTTYSGSGDWTDASTWTCELIEDYQECGPGNEPRLCNGDGTF
ncbi:hypothetical protein B0A50_04321 [Salinomyces thailandicus]|uniref:Carboxylic ester hydrolase n=1 Tax=Salinomyces thailandicus TaxID=706561 RepID=A0A4U0TYL7_9PEZI|nr:hypothetical protein B0A50_04321 [Salinomyces thailandica]